MTASYPSGSVPLGSPFYLERTLIEAQICEEIKKPGALIRIKAPKEMGKTSLLLRVLEYAQQQPYHTVSLNLEQVDESILNNLDRFLRWLCANVSYQLQLVPRLDEYWDADIGSKVSCTLYFHKYLLEQLDGPLVLAFDEVNCIFEHPQVAKDVLPLFRSWYEESKRHPVWQKLRLIVVHSTEIYVPLQLKQSPFNVGLPIELSCFTKEDVLQLAQRYGIVWRPDQAEVNQLMTLLAGHPALVHLTLYHLSQGDITFEQLLQTASTPTGIYFYHLQRHHVTLVEQPELASAFNGVIQESNPSLDPITTYKLSSMGLVKQVGHEVMPGCELYRQYFTSETQLPIQINVEIDPIKVQQEVEQIINSEVFRTVQAEISLLLQDGQDG